MAGVEGRGEGWVWQGQRYDRMGVETSATGELLPTGTMKSPGPALWSASLPTFFLSALGQASQ